MAKGPNMEIRTEAGGGGDIHWATFQQDTHWKLSEQRITSTRPDASHAAGVQKTSLGVRSSLGVQKVFQFHGWEAKGQLHLTPTPFPFLWLSCFLVLTGSHSHPSFPLLFP